MNFRDRLQQAARRSGSGDSQAAIAIKLERNPQTVNRWFMGGEPNAEQLLHVARTYGVNVEWLKTGDGEMLPQANDLPTDELELLRDYRKANAQARDHIRTVVRALRKSVLTIAAVIPPLLADSGVLHKNVCASDLTVYTLDAIRRWLLSKIKNALNVLAFSDCQPSVS